MQMSGNTILITGGGSGIGLRLAEEFHRGGNRVVIAGRDRARLEAAASRHAGIATIVLDVADPASVRNAAAELTQRFPDLNVLVNNAGIMVSEDMDEPDSASEIAEATVATNLLGPIRLTAALLPHLRRRPGAAIINVTSGLAFVPLALTLTYGATKAAMHSYTLSLRHRLNGTGVEVIELIPPAVQTDLMPGHASNPHAMPLDDFIAESMALFEQRPTPPEICVERVLSLRRAEADGTFEAVFARLNPAAAAA